MSTPEGIDAATDQVLVLARRHGCYGAFIYALSAEWSATLQRDHGMSKKVADMAAFVPGAGWPPPPPDASGEADPSRGAPAPLAPEGIDTLDLMRDEFQRIRALVRDDSEIAGLCDRAITNIHQRVPVIVQRDEAVTELARVRMDCITAFDRGFAAGVAQSGAPAASPPEGIDTEKLRAAVMARSRDRTHSEDCYLWGDHRDCAIMALLRMVDRLHDAIRLCSGSCHAALSTTAPAVHAQSDGANAPALPEGIDDLTEARADLRALAVALMECADDYDSAAKYKGDYLLDKHGDGEQAERYRIIARAALASVEADQSRGLRPLAPEGNAARLSRMITDAILLGMACIEPIPREDCERVARLVHQEIERNAFAIVYLHDQPVAAIPAPTQAGTAAPPSAALAASAPEGIDPRIVADTLRGLVFPAFREGWKAAQGEPLYDAGLMLTDWDASDTRKKLEATPRPTASVEADQPRGAPSPRTQCFACETPDGESRLIRTTVGWLAAEEFVEDLADGGNLAYGEPVYVRTFDDNGKVEYWAVTWRHCVEADALSSAEMARQAFAP